MIRNAARSLGLLVLFAMPALAHGQDDSTRLLRFPDIHGDRVVFCHAGDLWTAPATGGTAARLTAHPGREVFPRFSPDGQWIAFTGQYDGDEQVYVVPSSGGIPRQLTWYPARGPLAPRWGFDNQVYDWTADSKSVLVRSLRDGWDLSDSRLYTVSVEGGLPTPLPMPVSGAGDLSPDESQVVYAPLFRDFRTWKRYQGGWASDLYIFDLSTHDARQITDDPRSDRDPMWIGDRIYYNSDRDGTFNLYSFDPASGATERITSSTTWDVRWPADDGESRIVYEYNGELTVLDLNSGRPTAISIDVPNDGLASRPSRVDASDNIEGWELGPKGKRALFVARGDVFTVPVENGPVRNLTRSSDAHDRLAVWSPDGSKIAFVSDKSGEEHVYVIDQAGKGEAELLSDAGIGRLYRPAWSPTGDHVAYSDKEGKIYVVDVKTRRAREAADEPMGQVGDYTWSPQGGYLAFSLTDRNGFNSIYIYAVKGNKLHRITDEYFNETEPVWDPEGNYLFYFSDRSFAPQIGSFEWNYAVDRETGIFAIALREDVEHPFPPQSDEVEVESDEEEGDDEDEDSSDEKDEGPIAIDFEGLAQRVTRVPVEADNYFNLMAVKGHLLYVRGAPFYYGRSSTPDNELKIYSLEDREESALVADAGGYALSPDGGKVLVREGRSFKLYDAKPDAKGKSVSTSGLHVDRVPEQEWAQIFDEVWRRFRDFFYVDNMHGYDWEALGEQYRELLPHVAHRSDLNYLIGEMIAELNVSHAYIAGGDFEIPDRPRVALPGAKISLDESSGRYLLERIYRGQNEESRYRSPLTEIGVDAREGDFILAVDGEELRYPENPYRLLRHKSDRPVALTLAATASGRDSRDIEFNPITSEIPLRYMGWVESNRRMVDEATDGRVGYLHVPDMGSNGIREFIKWFYGQIRKEGLIIDVRGNGGGNVSQMLIERLRRELLRIRYVRTYDHPLTYPSTVFHGNLVCLLNETSASDGDVFPAMFKRAGLGPLIGKRSWGGVTGITGHGPLIDGGSVFVPQFGTNDRDDASWIIEGYGVDPDIEVENTPRSVIEGKDLQLERGIQELLEIMSQNPKGFPARPQPPVRTKAMLHDQLE